MSDDVYFFLDEIGTGTFGNVFRVRHLLTNQIVAAKVVPKNDPSILDSVRKEVSIYSKMDHPLIAHFYDEFETAQNIYIVQECAEGGSFLNFVNRNHGLSEQQCRFYFMQLLSVVEYLHVSMHVVHRDLKMENLLLDAHNNLRLIDFGLSEVMASDDQILEEPCGTPAYAAPEVILRKGYGYQIDVWGLGVLLYAMAAGRLPYYSEDVGSLVRMIVYDDLVFPKGMSPLLKDLIERLMKKDPAERITLGEIRRHPWLADATNTRDIESLKVGGIVDREVMKTMQELGVDVTNLASDMEQNVVNATTAVYKILKKKRIMEELNVFQQPEGEIPACASVGIMHMFSSSDVFVLRPMQSSDKRNRPSSGLNRRPMLRIPQDKLSVNQTSGNVAEKEVKKHMVIPNKVLPIVFASTVLVSSLTVLESS